MSSEQHVPRMSGEQQEAPSRQLFIDAVLSYQKTAAIKAAVELNLFSAIGAGMNSVDALAEKTGASPRGIRILCDYLTVLGFLKKTGSEYRQTPTTAFFLDSKSATDMSDIVNFLAGPELLGLYLDDPVSYVRNGGTKELAIVAPENPIWVIFARSKATFPNAAAEATAAHICTWRPAPRKVLDVAAGCGMFGIAIAKSIPEATIVAVDWRDVLAVAQENADRAKLGSRYRALAGDAFSVDWGHGYNLVLLPNILHLFDQATCVTLLSKVRSSLAPGGRALAIEFVPNEDRVSPPVPAMFAFMMLATTQRGDAFTFSEYDAMGRHAGYRRTSVVRLPRSEESIVEFHT
jgi:ubiquinone/menaquinone biosynthesis C-methylase UbiE